MKYTVTNVHAFIPSFSFKSKYQFFSLPLPGGEHNTHFTWFRHRTYHATFDHIVFFAVRLLEYRTNDDNGRERNKTVVGDSHHCQQRLRWCAESVFLGLCNQGPDLQNILRQSYDYLTIMPKLRSTYDRRLIYKTSYEGRKAFLRYDSLAKL